MTMRSPFPFLLPSIEQGRVFMWLSIKRQANSTLSGQWEYASVVKGTIQRMARVKKHLWAHWKPWHVLKFTICVALFWLNLAKNNQVQIATHKHAFLIWSSWHSTTLPTQINISSIFWFRFFTIFVWSWCCLVVLVAPHLHSMYTEKEMTFPSSFTFLHSKLAPPSH